VRDLILKMSFVIGVRMTEEQEISFRGVCGCGRETGAVIVTCRYVSFME